MEQISPEELSQRIAGGGCKLLDVRELWEYQLGALPDAVHLPLDQIPERHPELAPNQEWVVYCHHGIRSSCAIEFLQSVGFQKLKNLRGGIDAWSARVDPSVPRY